VKALGRALAVLAITATPRLALACPVCFGDANAPMTVATNNGIWFMLGIVFAVLTAFASFFIYLIRRANRVEEPAGPAADAGPYVRGQERTA
jgi:Na+-transporting NADH:ubiquinone oxidoreductase subunit NqrD